MTYSRLIRAVRAIVREVFPDYAYRCPYRYRVIAMDGSRVQLQALNANLGVPDIVPVMVRPGMSGLSANLTPGAVVLVQFIEGNPAMPYIAAFAAKDDPGFLPVELSLDAQTAVTIGTPATALPAARATDPVVCGAWGGSIVSGSPKVRIGS